MRALRPDLTPEELAEAVVGIDVHPLSVQIAKTTVLLALGEDVRKAKRPLRLRVYLANTLHVPEGTVNRDLFGGTFAVRVDGTGIALPNALLNDPPLFEAGLEAAEELAERTAGSKSVDGQTLQNRLRKRTGDGATPELIEGLQRLYRTFKTAKESGRDSIWHFLIQNTYKPLLLRGQFDYVIGNPPWLTYSDVPLAEYQDELRTLATRGGVMPQKRSDFPHTEIAAIFLSHVCTAFLKRRGKVAFVLPRAFLSANQHHNTRAGLAEGVRLTEVWDLDGVSPLFRVPSCVLFAEQAVTKRKIPRKGIPGYEVSGRLPEHNAAWSEAAPNLSFEPATWYLSTLGERSALTTDHRVASGKVNAYKDRFRQGATLVPRSFYFVAFDGSKPPDLDDDRLVALRTLELPEAKVPWKSLTLGGRVDGRFLYRTVLAQNLLPFALHGSMLTALPAERTANGFALRTAAQLQRAGYLEAAGWFGEAERLWEEHKTERNSKVSAQEWLNWQQKLTKQTPDAPFLVLYSASAKDANAVVVEQGTFDRPFVVDHVAYWFGTDNVLEAHYLAAFLNSNEPNRLIKDFQARGLFGARHVRKVILEVPLPRFDAANANHVALAAMGHACAQKAATWMESLVPGERGLPSVGRLRVALRAHLTAELKQIDAALRKVNSG